MLKDFMCNSWNHSQSCQCGFGGEGHLGRGAFINFPNLSKTYSFLTLNPNVIVQKGKNHLSYLTHNAHCPVCKRKVFFYQSPHGGRVFFDEVGHPWTKHPCTNNPLWRSSFQNIKFIGDETNQLAIYFIFKWKHDGYFPLICKEQRNPHQISVQLLSDEFQVDGKLRNQVDLHLNESVNIAVNSLFFIKEIHQSTKLFELKFCFRHSLNKEILTHTIRARTETKCQILSPERKTKSYDPRIIIIKNYDILTSSFSHKSFSNIEFNTSKKRNKNSKIPKNNHVTFTGNSINLDRVTFDNAVKQNVEAKTSKKIDYEFHDKKLAVKQLKSVVIDSAKTETVSAEKFEALRSKFESKRLK